MEEKVDDKKDENIETILNKIFKENRQLSIRIPAKAVNKLQIDKDKDGFVWAIMEDEYGLSLRGSLVKGAFENEKETNN